MNTLSRRLFDTVNTITCNARAVDIERAFDLCAHLERTLSRFVGGSDVDRINRANGKPVRIGADTRAVLQCAEEVRRASDGAFNIAMGGACRLWDFKASQPAPPSDERIAEALQTLQRTSVILEGGTVRATPGTVIDLGGIAKGYICGKAADYLKERGATSGILNFGGNIVTIGRHPEGRPWTVGIQTPRAQRESSLFASVRSKNNAVVTSGVYERCFLHDGTLYHHILDPRTCRPAASSVTSATIVAADPMYADALATTLLVLGDERGFALAHRFGAKAVTLHDDNRLRHSAELDVKLLNSGNKPIIACPLGS